MPNSVDAQLPAVHNFIIIVRAEFPYLDVFCQDVATPARQVLLTCHLQASPRLQASGAFDDEKISNTLGRQQRLGLLTAYRPNK